MSFTEFDITRFGLADLPDDCIDFIAPRFSVNIEAAGSYLPVYGTTNF